MVDCYIYDAVRTPRGKGRKDGGLHEVTPVELASEALRHPLCRRRHGHGYYYRTRISTLSSTESGTKYRTLPWTI
jgi:hypothetical protein